MSNRCRVLVVDDDPDVLEVVRLVLEADGHEVTTAADGRQAIELLATGTVPDVILLDLRMPVMDGWQFERERRERSLASTAALVVISSEPFAVATQLGPDEVLRKPLDAAAVSSAARLYCTQRLAPDVVG